MKKAIRYMLAVIIFANLVSCSQSQEITTTDETDTSELSDSESSEVRTPYIDKTDFGGESFTIFAPDWGLYTDFFFTDEQTGDAMNDALYERQMLVEEYLGIEIEFVQDGTQYNGVEAKVSANVMAGDDAYQLVLPHCIAGISSMMAQGLLYDWNEIPNVDLSREYWNQSCNENLSIYGKQYYAVSDFMIVDPNAILFNKELIEAYDLENPYELVHSNAWTLDKMLEMSSAVSSDVNGDNIYDYNDQYGFTGEGNWLLVSFFYSSGINVIEKDENDRLTLALNNDHTYTLVEKMDQLINRTNDAFLWNVGVPEAEMVTIASGRTLFQIESIQNLNKIRDCEVDFGIIPYPLLNESQDSYVTNNWTGLMCVPVTAVNLDMIGSACEMLAYYSSDTTIPAYYDVLLGDKLSRDPESREMLELIFDNVAYDAGMNFFGFSAGVTDLFYTLAHLVYTQKSGDFASWYNARESTCISIIDELMDEMNT